MISPNHHLRDLFERRMRPYQIDLSRYAPPDLWGVSPEMEAPAFRQVVKKEIPSAPAQARRRRTGSVYRTRSSGPLTLGVAHRTPPHGGQTDGPALVRRVIRNRRVPRTAAEDDPFSRHAFVLEPTRRVERRITVYGCPTHRL
eukprot:GHVU01057393.1.p1 GENE.GHVU01057393.1~~GHVU01057393.1.p1  ORF type:complete len:143 (+),score=0.35 GHVU01057393.1:315-743(+)